MKTFFFQSKCNPQSRYKLFVMSANNLKVCAAQGIILTLTSGSASADPGLSSLEGLHYLFLGALVLFIAGAALLGFLLLHAYRLTRSKSVSKRLTGGAIFLVIASVTFIVLEPFIDFNLYILQENEYTDATTIKTVYVKQYFELEDGRIFYLVDGGLGFFKPGRAVVLRKDSATATKMRVYDIFVASGSYMFFRQRKGTENKKLWIPIIPVMKDRYQLADRGPVIMLKPDWHFEDLAAHTKFIPWCCDPDWTRLLLDHKANPNQSVSYRLPLAQAATHLGRISDKAELQNIEEILTVLLSAGADVNAAGSGGYTPLHIAASSRHLMASSSGNHDALIWLLQHGANPTLRNHKGQTPLDLLRQQQQEFGQYWSDEMINEVNKTIYILEKAGDYKE